MGWRGCTFKNLDNAQSNPWRERKVEKGKERENGKKKVIKAERLKKGKEEEAQREGECYQGTCSPGKETPSEILG